MFKIPSQWYLTSTYYIHIKWKLSSARDVVGYEVWCSPTSRGPYYRVHVVDDRRVNQCTLPNMFHGDYFFVMTSLDARGNRSLRSNEVAQIIP